jgi:Flp pilus assembly protein TadB
MGIGGGVFLVALGAILTFAVNADPDVVDLDVVGLVLMLCGAVVLALTVWFWRDRRQRRLAGDFSLVEQSRVAHSHAPLDPESPASHLRPPAEP